MCIHRISCCCLPATSPCSVTKLWGGGISNSVSDWSEPSIFRLLLRKYFPVPPACPSFRHNYIQGIVWILPCPPTSAFLPPHRITLPAARPLSPSHNTATASSRHGVLYLPEGRLYPMPLSRLLPSLCCFLLPADFPSRRTCQIPVISSTLRLLKYFLTWPSIRYPPLSATTMGPVSAPVYVPLLLLHADLKYRPEGHSLCQRCLTPIDICPYFLGPCLLQHALAPLTVAGSHPVTYFPVSLSPAKKTLCGTPLYSSPWPLTGLTSLLQKNHRLYDQPAKYRQRERVRPLFPQDDSLSAPYMSHPLYVPSDHLPVIICLSSGRPRYLKSDTPSNVSSPSLLIKLNYISMYQLATSITLCLSRISMFLNQHAILWWFISRPDGMGIPQMLQRGSGSLPFCSTMNFERKCLYMKISLIQTALWEISRYTRTGHSINFKILGKNTTYVLVPHPPSSATRVCCGIAPCYPYI